MLVFYSYITMKAWTPEDIRGMRKRYKLSRSRLANLLGVTGNYVYLLEKGVRQPSKTLRLLLDCIERQLTEKEKGGKRYERNLQTR